MLLDFFYMLGVCCGSGASLRAMITHMQRLGREGRSLLIDIMTLDQLLLTYPELKPYLEDGAIIYSRLPRKPACPASLLAPRARLPRKRSAD